MKTLAMFFLLLLDSQHSSGVQVQVYEGAESVLLPCQVPADVSRRSTAVVWNRDEFTLPKVHMHKPNGDDLTNQNDRYLSRTRMRGDALQTGDLSLTLKNPTVSDSGHYTCTTRKAGEDLKKIYIQLKVSEPPPPVWPKVLAAVLVPVVLLTVLYGVFMHCEHKKLKHKAVCMLKPEKVTEGAESVKLPWRTIVDLSAAAVRVTWTRVQPTHREICECVKDQTGRWKLQAVDGYKDRVQMDPDSVTNGDFSLTLKYPRCEDGGFYLCVILDEDENPITLTIVAIWVKETWETAITGLFMCGRKETDTERRLTDEVSRILENSYGRQRIFQMVENLDGKENAEAARLLNA